MAIICALGLAIAPGHGLAQVVDGGNGGAGGVSSGLVPTKTSGAGGVASTTGTPLGGDGFGFGGGEGGGNSLSTGAGILGLCYGAMSVSVAELGAGLTADLTVPVQYGTLTPWVRLCGTGTLGNPYVSDTELLGSFSADKSALAAPGAAFTPAAGVELNGNGAWHLAAAWGGQFGTATSAENFTLEAKYVW